MPEPKEIIDIGDRIKIATTFTVEKVLTDPTTVTCRVSNPAGLVTTPAAIRASVGKYHIELVPAVKGNWSYEFTGTGAVQAVDQGEFYVRPSAF